MVTKLHRVVRCILKPNQMKEILDEKSFSVMPDSSIYSKLLAKKQRDKELNWSGIPVDQHEAFEDAEREQWDE